MGLSDGADDLTGGYTSATQDAEPLPAGPSDAAETEQSPPAWESAPTAAPPAAPASTPTAALATPPAAATSLSGGHAIGSLVGPAPALAQPPVAEPDPLREWATPQLRAAVEHLLATVRATRLPLDLPDASRARQLQQELAQVLDDAILRRLRNPHGPLLIAVAGGTGVGKSTLVNSIVRQVVSPAGVLRPTTRHAVVLCHPDDVSELAAAVFGSDARTVPSVSASQSGTRGIVDTGPGIHGLAGSSPRGSMGGSPEASVSGIRSTGPGASVSGLVGSARDGGVAGFPGAGLGPDAGIHGGDFGTWPVRDDFGGAGSGLNNDAGASAGVGVGPGAAYGADADLGIGSRGDLRANAGFRTSAEASDLGMNSGTSAGTGAAHGTGAGLGMGSSADLGASPAFSAGSGASADTYAGSGMGMGMGEGSPALGLAMGTSAGLDASAGAGTSASLGMSVGAPANAGPGMAAAVSAGSGLDAHAGVTGAVSAGSGLGTGPGGAAAVSAGSGLGAHASVAGAVSAGPGLGAHAGVAGAVSAGPGLGTDAGGAAAVSAGWRRLGASADLGGGLGVVPSGGSVSLFFPRPLPHPSLPPGIALVDTPDINSVVAGNREVGARWMAGADVVVFVTSAARYADAAPWRFLKRVAGAGTPLVVVVDRVGVAAAGEVRGACAELLEVNGLGAAPVFVVCEGLGTDGLVPAEGVAPVLDWLRAAGAEPAGRAAIGAAAVAGRWDGVLGRVGELAAACGGQRQALDSLQQAVERTYTAERVRFRSEVEDGELFGGEVLIRWQELVAAGRVKALMGAGGPAGRRAAGAERAVDGPLRAALLAAVGQAIQVSLERAVRRTEREWELVMRGDAARTPAGTTPTEGFGRPIIPAADAAAQAHIAAAGTPAGSAPTHGLPRPIVTATDLTAPGTPAGTAPTDGLPRPIPTAPDLAAEARAAAADWLDRLPGTIRDQARARRASRATAGAGARGAALLVGVAALAGRADSAEPTAAAAHGLVRALFGPDDAARLVAIASAGLRDAGAALLERSADGYRGLLAGYAVEPGQAEDLWAARQKVQEAR